MNHINLDNSLQGLKTITLTPQEKQSIKDRVMAYADGRFDHNRPPESPYWHVWIWNYSMTRRVVMYVTIFLMFLATSSGGLASAADYALPGDLLYDFKVNVMEPAGVVLAIGSQAKAGLVAKFASRRLAEAETLASQGRLDAVKAEEIRVRFVKHAEAFNALEKKVELNGSTRAIVKAQEAKTQFAGLEDTLKKVLKVIPFPDFSSTSTE